ncbi:MAG: FAD:protein FMN transferase, partial [Phycisphaerae bacterium]
FDVTVGPLVDLWHISGDTNVPPTPEQIDSAREKIGYQKLLLDSDNRTVQFAQEGMKIDLGGIAKGYAVDRAVKAMKFAGAFGGMVDLGGNIRCFGIPAGKKSKWLIGLQDPNTDNLQFTSGKLILKLEIPDRAIATSGDYRRFTVIEGQKHSHIIDTAQGQSSSKLSSVTIIAADAADADALSTAVSILGEKKGIELIEALEDIEAVLITPAPEYRQILTGGADRYIYKP